MAIFVLIIVLLFAVMAVIFAVQNVEVVPISFLLWQTEGSLALVLLLALVIGVVIGLLVTLPTRVKFSRQLSKRKKEIAELEGTIQEQAGRISALEGEAAEKEELEAPVEEPLQEVIEDPVVEETEETVEEGDEQTASVDEGDTNENQVSEE
ncbi:lipopolysaccharide assembly LapA domain-containing protein [Chloroflexota bacterium]